MPVAVKAAAEVDLVERLCRSLGVDPGGVDELTIAFKVGERPIIRIRRWAGQDTGRMLVDQIERYAVTVDRR